jgi:hypothetical protein
MFANSIAVLMIASILTAQGPVPDVQAAPPAAPNAAAPAGQGPAAPIAQTITLPAGTVIPLTLMTVLKSKSTKAGDSVRAVVAFPVTQGTQLAIPAGTYVEGVVNKLTARPASNQQPTLRVHFNRLVFSNGYSAPLNGENTQALVAPEELSAPANETAELAPIGLPGAMGAGQSTTPTLPPLPQVGPSPGVIIGATTGAFAAITIGMVVWWHHRVNSYDYAVFDAGWQFQMILDGPVTLDAAQVAAAAVMAPSAN